MRRGHGGDEDKVSLYGGIQISKFRDEKIGIISRHNILVILTDFEISYGCPPEAHTPQPPVTQQGLTQSPIYSIQHQPWIMILYGW